MAGAGGARAESMGVEEEFLLVDPDSRRLASGAGEVRRVAAELDLGDFVEKELTDYQLETATDPCATLEQLRTGLIAGRKALVTAAARAGYRAVASGTAVLGAPERVAVTPDSRYERMHREYREMLADQWVCGCHIHVGLPDRETAVLVSNHLRPWLPVLQAISGNSPFADGVDTGYASWRTLVWSRWPVAGPAPFWRDLTHHDAFVDCLIRSGVILDPAMVYWYARPSAHVPTLEIRVCDVMPSVDDVVLVAGLVRGLVGAALRDLRDGIEAVDVPGDMLRAAHWRAARDGLTGSGVDPASGEPVPATELVRRLVRRVRDVLDQYGDTDEIDELLDRLAERGAPAQRQRAVHQRNGDARDVVDYLIAATASRSADHSVDLRIAPGAGH